LEADFQHYYRLDLRYEFHHTSSRRVWVLVQGLPPDAAVWRRDGFAPTEELLVQLLERHDQWARSHLQAMLGHKRVNMPAPFQIMRPGEEPPSKPKIETDPRVIAAWFASNIGEGEGGMT